MSYEAWRITFQDSEQAARSAFADVARLNQKYGQAERLIEALRACPRYETSINGWLCFGCGDEAKSQDAIDHEHGCPVESLERLATTCSV